MLQAKKFIFYHLPPILWAVLIYFASSLPKLNISLESGSDKLAHFIVFAIFCWLVDRSLKNNENIKLKFNTIYISILLTSLYGISDEIHQYFVPNRFSDVYDVVADFFGAVGYFLFSKILNMNKK
ncbi:MAG: VanZ family protein [Bacteroidetes bacterium]|nr:VanZ family protein [Bacteroidota bacterium]